MPRGLAKANPKPKRRRRRTAKKAPVRRRRTSRRRNPKLQLNIVDILLGFAGCFAIFNLKNLWLWMSGKREYDWQIPVWLFQMIIIFVTWFAGEYVTKGKYKETLTNGMIIGMLMSFAMKIWQEDKYYTSLKGLKGLGYYTDTKPSLKPITSSMSYYPHEQVGGYMDRQLALQGNNRRVIVNNTASKLSKLAKYA